MGSEGAACFGLGTCDGVCGSCSQRGWGFLGEVAQDGTTGPCPDQLLEMGALSH